MLKLLTWIWNLAQRNKCTCVLNELVGFRGVDHCRDARCPEHGDAALMNSGRCPDCRGTSFTFGPEGGIGRGVTCDTCASQFLVQVIGEIDDDPVRVIYWGRIIA